MIERVSYQLGLGLDIEERVDDGDGWVSGDEARLRELEALRLFEGGEEKPVWYEEYEALVYGGWPKRAAMYIAWASCPKKGRWPKTLDELASLMGLRSPRVIHQWRQRNPEIERQVSVMQAAPLFKHRADAIQALVESASDPDYRHAPDRRTLFTMTGDLEDTINVRRSGSRNDLSQMSDAELAELAGALKTLPPGPLSVNDEGELDGDGDE
jgi:hypothetical protein